MSKFKAGDEVRQVRDADSFVRLHGKDTVIVECVDGCSIKLVGGDWWYEENFELVEQWTIYNNTTPLCRLIDERASELFNHWRSGNPIERKDKTAGWRYSVETMLSRHETYRAKQKSERELFIEAALNAANKYNAECDVTFAEAMFDAGFKAPKGSE